MADDFTSIMERQGMGAIAVDGLGLGGTAPDAPAEGFDAIPMWVADMNFPTAPSITRAMAKRIEHPAFGYFSPRDKYYQAIIDWQRRRNGVDGLEPGHIGYENGVLGGVVSTLTALAAPGDAVLLHSPTYIGFTHCIEENGYRIVLSPLVQDKQGVWRMDFVTTWLQSWRRTTSTWRCSARLAAQPVRARVGALGDRARDGRPTESTIAW